ncbi:hypothetical protein AB9T89_07875 [Flavobacterium oncorhynchi]
MDINQQEFTFMPFGFIAKKVNIGILKFSNGYRNGQIMKILGLFSFA